jgi:hypothetical protein
VSSVARIAGSEFDFGGRIVRWVSGGVFVSAGFDDRPSTQDAREGLSCDRIGFSGRKFD